MAETSHQTVETAPQYAGLGSRALAAIVDWVLLVVVNIILGGISIAIYGLDAGITVFDLLGIVVFFGYFIVLEAYNDGQTLGKMLANIRVTTTSGEDLDVVGSLVRNVLRIVDVLPFVYIVGIIAIAATDKEQRVGDLAAGTVVVKE